MFLHSAASQVVVFAVWTIALCFVWPALEAIVVEHAGSNQAKVVGYYNVTWASGAAIAYFTTGILLEHLGMQSLFWLPLCLIPFQLVLLPVAARLTKKENHDNSNDRGLSGVEAGRRSDARHFLHMAWLANPLSYVAINTILPLIPSISGKLGLSTGTAGIVCSLWMFMRLGVFVFLQRWTKWHYRWSGLAGSFVLMIASFIGIILTPNLFTLIAVQIGFGLAIGLLYYSSLYYSIMVSDKKEANCGVHEAMVGLGQFVGPAVGAGSLVLFPGAVGGGVMPVGALLLAGFGGLVWMRVQFKKAV
jgi:MFS family permease